MRRSLMAIIALLALMPQPAAAHTWHVPGDAITIQLALNLTDPGDSVIVAAGTYLEHDILVPDGVVLRSETGLPDCVTIDARGLGRVMRIEGGYQGVAVEGFTIQGGDGVELGGGIHVDGNVWLRDLLVRDNRATENGGGIYARTVWMTRITCSNNVAGDYGGGIFVEYLQSEYPDFPWWHELLLIGNRADLGSALTIIECPNSFHISGLTVTGNYTPLGIDGSAIHIYTCESCVVQFPAIFNAIVAYNQGYGLTLDDADYRHHISFSGHDPILSSSTVFGNELDGYGGTFFDLGGWFGNIALDPLFCDQAGGDYHLQTGSPCLPEGNSSRSLMGAFGSGCQVTAVPDQMSVAGEGLFALHQNHPNPFNPVTEITFSLPSAAMVSLLVYDLSGRLVRSLAVETQFNAGYHRLTWNGTDDNNKRLASGLYLYQLIAGDFVETRKMILLK